MTAKLTREFLTGKKVFEKRGEGREFGRVGFGQKKI
jgi:hypothetical protein